jgi:DNA-binding MarR family transcriptional regulator
MKMDVVAELGYLALGTRLKRLAEQLQAGVAEAIAEEKIAVQPSQLVLLLAIDKHEGEPVAGLVEAVGISQPAISRTLGALVRLGLVQFAVNSGDRRARRAKLTSRGRSLLDDIRTRLFHKVAAAAEELCEGTNLLPALAKIEARNRRTPFVQRIRRASP